VAFIQVEVNYCKGCGLCIPVCRQGLLELSDEIGASGYHSIQIKNAGRCTGCCYCALVCPEAAIEVFVPVKEETP
jgi:2-oxoglutarate ferredoxin oxidoreductase subunit delta